MVGVPRIIVIYTLQRKLSIFNPPVLSCVARITAITNPILEKEFEVRYNDLDVNGHANNGNYIVWAFEPLSFEFRSEYKLKTLDMLFKKYC